MTKETQGIYLPTYGYHSSYYELVVGDVVVRMIYEHDKECWKVTAEQETKP